MNRRIYGGILVAFACLTAGLLASCSSGSGKKVQTVVIAATSGSPQGATVGAPFAAPLVAMVTTGGTPTSDVMVTFTAPGSGASGTFANGMASEMDQTNSSGLATSSTFTANTSAGAYSVSASAPGAANPASYNLTNSAGPAAAVVATSGTPQSATVSTAFALPLVATVTDSHGNRRSASVTFTAPGSGASGTFSNGTATETDRAIITGVATSSTFKANGTVGGPYTVTATVAGVAAPANFNLTNTAAVPVIAVQSGSGQSATVSTAFGAPLVVTVMLSGAPISGASVTFTAPGSGASGTFSNGTNTEMDTTNASGVATSSTFKANATAGGPYTVTATVMGAAVPPDFSLTNTAAGGGSQNFAFYLSGEELSNSGANYYALAGAVAIAANGTVTGGVQDYNDAYGFLSPQPGGDSITGGNLTINSTTGQGTLTLITNNANLGVAGTETFGVQFVNTSHAFILQFDGSATSSGSMDLQTLGSPVINGGLAFILTGVDTSYFPVAIGGVGTNSAAGLSGTSDTNDNGTLKLNSAFSGATIQPVVGNYGRGTITGIKFAGTPFALNYYLVRPNVIRIIDVDTGNAAIGSAFGQGTNATGASNGALGTSVLYLAANPFQTNQYGALAQFTTTNTTSNPADFSGVGDENKPGGVVKTDSAVSGTYNIMSNGYGSLTVTNGGLGSIDILGLYMTDPTLNLDDPNNSTGGGGGLLLDQSSILVGGLTGFVIPQTDTATASFAGNYAVGWQNYNNFSAACTQCEFDMAAQGTVAAGAGAMSFTGLVSDPFLTLGTGSATATGATFTGTPQADSTHAGRYTMFSTNAVPNALAASINGHNGAFNLVIYQASGGQLFWLETDSNGVFTGPLQKQASLTGLPAVVDGPVANSQDREKQ